jgi:hypothetical protein
MSFNVWGTVSGVQYALVMETLLGAANTVLGMNAAADQLQYKPVTITSAGAVAGVTSLTMAGALAGVTTLSMSGALSVGGDATLSGDALLASGKVLKVNAVKVVEARKTGWTAATGNATRTTYDTTTVTTAQLAERVKALLDDLITHGLIGT